MGLSVARRATSAAAAILAALRSLACGAQAAGGDVGAPPQQLGGPLGPGGGEVEIEPPAVPPVSPGEGGFAATLFVNATQARLENACVSPLSVRAAFAMLLAGAKGETAKEISKVIGVEPARIEALGAELRAMQSSGEGKPALRIANGLYVQKGSPLLPAFTKTLTDCFGAPPEALDFARSAEAARASINAAVEEQTESKIKEILPRDSVNGAKIVLTNAVYFKAPWATAFEPGNTRQGPFTRVDGTSVSVPFMNLTATFGYAANEAVEVLEMPYRGLAQSMVLVLPRGSGAFVARGGELVTELATGKLPAPAPQKIRVSIPKFRVKSSFALIPALKAAGMTAVFGAAADLSGIDGAPGLFVSGVFHETYVDVDEQGTEAAAATAVAVPRSRPPESPSFVANRPFVFAIRDVKSGALLFVGHYVGV